MSDPVKNAEVEDVLSSVRRLVSEDKRPVQPPAEDPAADRLVLTPSLRVADTPKAETTPPGTDPQDAKHAEIAGPERAEAEQPEREADVPQAAPVSSDPADDYTTDPYNFADETDEDGERDADPTGRFTAPEADVSPRDADQNMTGAETIDDDPVDARTASDAATPEDFSPEIPADAAQKAATLSAKIEALETAIGAIPDTWEPDGSGTDAYAGTQAPAMAWEDDVAQTPQDTAPDAPQDRPFEATSEAAPEVDEDAAASAKTPETAAEGAPEDLMDLTDGDHLIDEEALRDLVSEIVREELQGALGERITRNVRKLVRREIHRALTAQDLE